MDAGVAHVMPWNALAGAGRGQAIVAVRRRYCLILRERGWSYPDIGDVFNRDHTSIMSLVKQNRRKSTMKSSVVGLEVASAGSNE